MEWRSKTYRASKIDRRPTSTCTSKACSKSQSNPAGIGIGTKCSTPNRWPSWSSHNTHSLCDRKSSSLPNSEAWNIARIRSSPRWFATHTPFGSSFASKSWPMMRWWKVFTNFLFSRFYWFKKYALTGTYPHINQIQVKCFQILTPIINSY